MRKFKSPYFRKLGSIKYFYGESAKEHFIFKPICEKCGEERIVCLTIHHTEGKKVERFMTLCHNCHALIHANRSGEYKATDHYERIREVAKKGLRVVERNKAILVMLGQGYSLRETGRKFNLTHVTIKNIRDR